MNQDTWSIPEALAVAYKAYTERFGADLLMRSFEALAVTPEATMAEHTGLGRALDQYLGHALTVQGANVVIWMGNARSDPAQAVLLLHTGVRWWRARDDLLQRAPTERVPRVYADGLSNHVKLQLLSQMLYRGAAPDTVTLGPQPTRGSRG